MEFTEWQSYYKEVINLLDLDHTADQYSATQYYDIILELNKNNLNRFSKTLIKIREKKPRYIWVFGAGPSVENDFNVYKRYSSNDDLVVAADGVSLFLFENNITPDLIFTDLDGSIKTLEFFCKKKTILIVHAHGDNLPVIKKHMTEINRCNFLPTIQTKPIEPILYNFGGFTDGDRAVSACLHWFKSTIILLGFTFGSIQGKYSKPEKFTKDMKASEFKIKKLDFAIRFLQVLAHNYPNKIWNLSNPSQKIKGISDNIYNLHKQDDLR